MAEGKWYYSCRSGGNYYRAESERIEVFGTPRQVVTHMPSGTRHYLVPCDPFTREAMQAYIDDDPLRYPPARRGRDWWWRTNGMTDDEPFNPKWMDDHYWDYLIERPLNRDLFVWPVDVLVAESGRQLVFPIRRDLADFRPLRDALANINDRPRPQFAWSAAMHDRHAVPLVNGLLAVWQELERCGYLYGGFSIDHMYVETANPGHVICDFNQSTLGSCGLSDGDGDDRGTVTLIGRLTGEYLDPYQWSRSDGRSVSIDAESERFTLAAMLFRVMVGRMPYDGRAIEPDWAANTDAQMHEVWVRQYQNDPVFIFDPQDEGNIVGGDDSPESDRHFVANWRQVNPAMRDLFVSVFRTDNAMRTGDEPTFPTARQWRQTLEQQ